ncbi:MAG TPA: YhcH/YjgK/YiaL family protein [Kiritimatiellia bacterium]|jgi:YhcH/YjgK/YiaL family protein|nr:YhcH/YjgK/YiaL family protein [Kiritimatiellia bacterium]HPW76014.1 YhcH/YjgK/YiaL family protein [Kiritimatiellia bacterium]
MILDTLDSSFRYETLHPLFPSAFAFLRRPDLDALACGRIDLAGDDALYALIQTYETQPPAEGKPEAHRRYLDIQYVVSGSECVAYAPLAGLTPCQPFDEAGDYGLYTGSTSLVRLSQGMFAIFYPNDAHLPCRQDGHAAPVRKIVIKVKVSE